MKHIEILEGPAARVYGTSSLLGAINISKTTFTKQPFRTCGRRRAMDILQKRSQKLTLLREAGTILFLPKLRAVMVTLVVRKRKLE